MVLENTDCSFLAITMLLCTALIQASKGEAPVGIWGMELLVCFPSKTEVILELLDWNKL